MRIVLSFFIFVGSLMAQDSYYYSFGKKVTVKKIPQTRALGDQNITYYENQNGQKLGVKHEVIIGCDNIKECEKVLQNYDILSVEKLSKTIFLLKLPKDTDLFNLSNKLYKEKSIKFAHPNFIKKRIQR